MWKFKEAVGNTERFLKTFGKIMQNIVNFFKFKIMLLGNIFTILRKQLQNFGHVS